MYELQTEEARKARREYQKKWRKNNPDKIRDAQERYWIKKYKQTAESAGQ